MATYHWSFEEDGIATPEIDQALTNATHEREWRTGLLRTGYVIWIDQQESFNGYNQRMLLVTHLALSLGVTLLLLAGGLYLIGA